MIKLTICVLLLSLTNCSMKPKFNDDYKKTDLIKAVADSADYYVTKLYEMPTEYTNDLIVSMVRVNAIEVETSKVPITIALHLLATKNKSEVDTAVIHSKLTNREWAKYLKAFPDALIKNHSVEQEIRKHQILANELTCEPPVMDAHWAQFSVTGDLTIVDKMIDSYRVVNTPCYFDVLQWSIAAQAAENRDVYDYLITKKSKAKQSNQGWYERFIPEKRYCKW